MLVFCHFFFLFFEVSFCFLFFRGPLFLLVLVSVYLACVGQVISQAKAVACSILEDMNQVAWAVELEGEVSKVDLAFGFASLDCT